MIEIDFDPIKHEYTSSKTKRKFISATTLIHKYSPPYPREFWGMFKAMERVTKENYGYNAENLIKSYKGRKWYRDRDEKSLKQFIDKNRDDKALIEATKEVIFAEWAETNRIACEKGTNYHNAKEAETIANSKVDVTYEDIDFQLPVFEFKMDLNLDELEEGFYPELRMWLNEFEVSGTSDCVYILPNRWAIIEDYKTNKRLDFENKYQKMLYPLNHLDDCNWNHYKIQLSLYMYMLETRGYIPKSLAILYNEERLEFEYMREEVIAMLQHYQSTKTAPEEFTFNGEFY